MNENISIEVINEINAGIVLLTQNIQVLNSTLASMKPSGLSNVKTVISDIISLIGGLGGAATKLIGSMNGIQTSMKIMGLVAGPSLEPAIAAIAPFAGAIGGVALAIALLIGMFALLWTFNDGFRESMIGIWDELKGKIDAFLESIAFLGPAFQGLFELIMIPISISFGFIFGQIFGTISNVLGSFLHTATEVINGVKTFFIGLFNVIQGLFTGDMQKVLDGLKGMFYGAFQAVKAVLVAPINGLIALVNGIIDGINSISIDIPGWIPVVGGMHFQPSIPKIPMLAEGGTLMSGGMAIVGEAGPEMLLQRGAKTSVIPLTSGQKALGKDSGSNENIVIQLNLDGKQVAQIVNPHLKDMNTFDLNLLLRG